MVLNKTDLLPYVSFDPRKARANRPGSAPRHGDHRTFVQDRRGLRPLDGVAGEPPRAGQSSRTKSIAGSAGHRFCGPRFFCASWKDRRPQERRSAVPAFTGRSGTGEGSRKRANDSGLRRPYFRLGQARKADHERPSTQVHFNHRHRAGRGVPALRLPFSRRVPPRWIHHQHLGGRIH